MLFADTSERIAAGGMSINLFLEEVRLADGIATESLKIWEPKLY
jgi:hypothetical protein